MFAGLKKPRDERARDERDVGAAEEECSDSLRWAPRDPGRSVVRLLSGSSPPVARRRALSARRRDCEISFGLSLLGRFTNVARFSCVSRTPLGAESPGRIDAIQKQCLAQLWHRAVSLS